jgi:soluble lytic murein transglycosylase-like protein
MKPTGNKKLMIRLLSVGRVGFLFVLVMILMVSFSSDLDSQKLKPMLDKKPAIAKAMSSQPKEKEYTAAKIEHSLAPVSGNKTEHLFHPIIIQTAIRYQIDPALVKAIIMAESGYNSKAISKKGAIGLMQLTPKTAQELNVEDIFNPKENIDGGVRYFKQLVNQFSGDLKLALAAYNAGKKTVKHYKGVPPFKETQHYIKKVFEYFQLYKNQMTEEADRA